MSVVGRHIEIRGIVQGVGFRPWVYNLARASGITGYVSNDARGVIIDAFATAPDDGPALLDVFVGRLRAEGPPAARIDDLSWSDIAIDAQTIVPERFEIAASTSEGEREPAIPADLATCEECAAEIADPRDRRYRYAFTSCTHCGPRFTITEDTPYDRATTTMAPFAMCEDCQREYDDPADRRFHAQPNACPRCGPTLRFVDAQTRTLDGEDDYVDPIAHTAALLAGGAIVAIKGLGGFHLACDATRDATVRELRRRKRREEKPLAIMVRDLRAAEALVVLGDAERALLLSPAHPIVIAPRRLDTPEACAIAPSVVRSLGDIRAERLGVMLPYTPLHHVLLGDLQGTPLVMTSGNASDEPIAYRDEDAFARLTNIADAFLVHDRAIVTRADDSVALVVNGAPVLVRRSRGYTPRRISLAGMPGESTLADAPILACGAHLKNTFCFGDRSGATFGPHIGDLDDVSAFEDYERSIARLESFLHRTPRVIVHDMHPDYASTRYAIERAARSNGALRAVAVQHHHAHVASAIVEHGLYGEPVIGVALDGTGFGTDGTSWGGEVLVADLFDFERVAALRNVALPGGDLAIREPWRIALALLDDAFGPDEAPLDKLELFGHVTHDEIRVVRQMLAKDINTPRASGAGRYFDAFGALGLARRTSRFEAQLPMAWEQIAWMNPGRALRPYPFAIDMESRPWRIDLRPMTRAVVHELAAQGQEAAGPEIASRFHDTMAMAFAETVREVARRRRREHVPVVLTGGCFMNARLTEALVRALGESNVMRPVVHREVPPGDGGVALGQLAIAAAWASRHEEGKA